MKHFNYNNTSILEKSIISSIYSFDTLKSPDSEYEVTFQFYNNPNKTNGYIKFDKHMNYVFPIGIIYVKSKTYAKSASFEYLKSLELDIKTNSDIRNVSIVNISEIEAYLNEDWIEIKKFVPYD